MHTTGIFLTGFVLPIAASVLKSWQICHRCDCEGTNITCEGIMEGYELETMPPWVREVFVWECRVPKITKRAFRHVNRNLKVLQILESDLTWIDPGTFSGMINLVFLDLSHNPIGQGITGDLFKDLVSLKYLNLSSSEHASIHIDDFAVFDRTNFPQGLVLQEMTLSHTQISRLSTDISLPPIVRLNLEDMVISYINGANLRIADYSYDAKIDHRVIKHLNIKGSGTVLDGEFFEKFSNLECLEASQATVNYKDLNRFQNWKNLRFLNLSRIEIHKRTWKKMVWNIFPENIQTLDISNDIITDLELDRQITTLHSLLVSQNQLSHFNLLEKLPNLIELDLSSNHLLSVPMVDPEKTLNGLKSINLAHNRITNLISEAFRSYPNLVSLNLKKNQLKFFSEKMFQLLPSLETLDLSENRLQSFRFRNMSSVRDLKLNRNNLELLSTSAECCYNLETLDLAENVNLFTNARQCVLEFGEKCTGNQPLAELEKLVFVKVLDLGRTDLEIFPAKLLEKLPYLEYFSIAGNELTDSALNQGLGTIQLSNVRLEFLNLSANRFTTVSKLAKAKLSGGHFRHLDLSNNDFICSCQLARAFDMLRFKLLRYFGLNSVQGRFYECYLERDAESLAIEEYMFLRSVRESCLMNYGRRNSAGSNLVIYMLLFVCCVSVAFSLAYIVLVKRRRRRVAKETYTSVDYVILDSNGGEEHSSGISL